MELSIVTAEQQTSDGVRERLLLHWVNSLPLTKCLLVEELRDLRFGDVLSEIVKWLQNDETEAGAATSDEATEDDVLERDAIAECLCRVVQYAASECRSQDEDAMYVVNDVECVDRVMAGRSDDICAVLTVLKRLSVQRLQEYRLLKGERNALRRRRAQEEVITNALQQSSEPRELHSLEVETKQRSERMNPSSSRPHRRIRPNATKVSKAVEKVAESKGTKHKMRPSAAVKKRLDKPPPTTQASSSSSVENEKMSHQTGINGDDGLRVFGMLDPTAKYQLRVGALKTNGDNRSCEDDVLAARFCSWVQHFLKVEMPLEQLFAKQADSWKLHSPRKVRQVFASGVLLCHIAAGIVQRYGEQLNQRSMEGKIPRYKDLTSVADPTTPSERMRNLASALVVFKGIGIFPEALNSFECLQRPGKQVSPMTIWAALDEVFRKVSRLVLAATTPSIEEMVDKSAESSRAGCDPEKSAAHDIDPAITTPKEVPSKKKAVEMDAGLTGCAPLKRSMPYITSEQMHVVNEWLIGVGFDVKKTVGRGVLHDPMRNGVLLCTLLVQVLKRTSFSYCKAPRTLTEMRENISKAFATLGDVSHGRIPACYSTSSAEQAVLIGDRQISYGVLWHIWQASHAAFGLAKTKVGSEQPPTGLHETRKAEGTPVKPSPLLLDIPAVALAGHGKLAIKDDLETAFQVKLHDSFARRLAWSDHLQHGDEDDDVFPVPKAPFSSPVYSEALDLVPTETHAKEIMHQTEDDILPVRSWRSSSAESTGHEWDQGPAPTIALAELSATTPGKPAKEDETGSAVPSPAKPSAVHPHLNGTFMREPVEEILAWLKRLGIRLMSPSTFHDPSAQLAEFQSGVRLCCIVEKVELMRSIPGITRPSGKQPLSKASSLHNITKALDILQQKKTMPLHLLRRANAIYAGNRDVILQLLLQIRKAYGHHHTRRRPKQFTCISAA